MRRPALIVFGGAALLAAALIAASLLGSRGGGAELGPPAQTADRLLRGIPQEGVALGRPDGPVTLVEYADLQCPFCARWARDSFPAIVDEYVRPGHVRLVFRGLAFIGPDTEVALRAALAAGAQDRLWDVVHELYASQGAENGGWVTERLLRHVGLAAGADADRMLGETHSAAVERELAAAMRAAQFARIPGTPAFEVGATGGAMRRLELHSLDAEALRARLDELLKR